MRTGFGLVLAGVCLLAGCGSTPQGGDSNEEQVSAIQLKLSTVAPSGTEYRLGPATIDILDPYGYPPSVITTVEADGAEPTVFVPLQPRGYLVEMRPGWTLSRVEGETLTPIAATLTSPPQQYVSVAQFEASPVTFAFHLGQSGIDLGVTVDEGILPGYDGRVLHFSSGGSYSVELRGGSGSCCYNSFAEAQAAYPYSNLYLVEQ
jgi:hypothetical protein